MTIFWIICAVMLVVALPFLMVPLWRSTGKNNDVLRDAANLEILRDQSAELEADLRNGLLTQEAYDQGKLELQKRLLDEVKTTEQEVKSPRNPAKKLALVLAVLLPLLSVPLYLKIGKPDAMLGTHANANFANMTIEDMVLELEKKVAQEPENPNHLVMLARTYAKLNRFPDSVRAYSQLVKMVPNEPNVWVEYAQAVAMTKGGSLKGEPATLINKALELDGNHLWGLQLSGESAAESGDYVLAITHWQKLLSLLPQDDENTQTVRNNIQNVRAMLAQQPGGQEKLAKLPASNVPETPAGNPAAAITGKVTVSPALAGKVLPSDTVYILARAAQGPKMPLAVLRKQAKDLPLEFKLDDTMAMQQQFKLSNFDQVVVVARVSKSGTPMGQPGDLEGKVTVKTGSKGLNIVIDTVVQ